MNTNLVAIIAQLSTVLVTNWTGERNGWFVDTWVDPLTGEPPRHIPKMFKQRVVGEIREVTSINFVVDGKLVQKELSSRVVATGAKWVWTELIVKSEGEMWTNELPIVQSNILHVLPLNAQITNTMFYNYVK